MKTTIITIAIITALVLGFYLVNNAVDKTELATCQKYVEDATTFHNWFISKADNEMCKYHGLDFSDFLK